MTGEGKTNWSIWEMPVGPEAPRAKKCVFRAPQAETMVQYEMLREQDTAEDGPFALVVTDQNGDPVYACS